MQSDDKRKLPLQYLDNDGMKSILESASLQIVESIQKAAEQFGVANDHQMLRKEKLDSLRYQITELVSPSNRIRSVMERRVLEFIERVITSPSSQNSGLILVPNGLSTFYDDLVQISSLFTRLVSYNRAVYSPHYTKIIAKLAQNKHFISDIDLKTIEKSFYD
ncbi:hypothetical protein SSS_05683 [Sarcoptes scabiei]|nr:hypothetical protein SSS_05683 [Sarcoptes scabiei]